MRTRSGQATQGVRVDTSGTTVNESTAQATTVNSSSKSSSSSYAAAIPETSSSLMPPYVTDISHPALVMWKRERREYEDAVEARCAATGEGKDKALRSVKNSFNRNLLEALCKFEWNTTVEAITDAQIVAELDRIVGNVMNDVVVDVDLIFCNKLKMDLRERGVKERVINYFMLCDEIILQYGVANTFATVTGMKKKVSLAATTSRASSAEGCS
ncbi:uncharacterized protein IUM83_18600 [Phytophthora cinnamomi]|uniref:uncharacterized protein n=1 Tax=Phytophthora cinnamomi TaxID=4785 RepID=UPI00355A98C5|nr:hypothetical protein IUM83_18600 [Phytophthora cinnamomi]